MCKFADMGLESFVRGNALWEGDHTETICDRVGENRPYVGKKVFLS